jgi:aryl-alcohol dehydrogenase-like predicted oxidoreductase
MKYRKFGNTDLIVSEIGFGAWAIGGGAMVGNTAIGWGDADDVTSKAAIQAAVNNGITFFDTADIYGLGHSESLLGELLRNNKNIVIATKVGNVARHNEFTTDYSKAYILKSCEASLKRLGRETIDYYQLHSARVNHLQQGECIEAMLLLQQQGKIRYWGLSLNTFYPEPEGDYLLQHNAGNGFQLVLNIINQKALQLLKKAAAKRYGIIARMPLQFGLLTGKFNETTTFNANDHRHNRLTKEVIEQSSEALQPVWKLCEKYSITKTTLALSYVLSYDEVSTVIPGIRTPQQVMENTIGLVQLEEEDKKMIESLNETTFNELMHLIQQQG